MREDTPPDSIIAKLEALDLDSGQFGQITYFLDRSSSYGGQFQIHPDTGELSTGKIILLNIMKMKIGLKLIHLSTRKITNLRVVRIFP